MEAEFNMSKIFISVVVSVSLALSLACRNISSSGINTESAATAEELSPVPEPTPTIHPKLLNAKSSELCDRLAEIKKLPNRDPDDTDPLYEALIAKGDQAYSCLIEKITVAKKMPDPREAPKWKHYAVGDTAIFILVRSVGKTDVGEEELLKEMLPPPFRKEWETNGIYAYFNYVSDPNNRKTLQLWWKNRLSRK